MDLSPYAGPLLLAIGVFLQYTIRAAKSTSDLEYLGWALAACVLVYGLTAPDDARKQIVDFLLWMFAVDRGAVWKVLVGTQVTSTLANIAVRFGARVASALVPVTNSKEVQQ